MSDVLDTPWQDPVIPDSAWEGADDGEDLDAPDDVDDGLDGGAPPADDGAGEGEAPPEPTPPPAAETPAPTFDDPARLIEHLRNENAEHRVRLKTYEQALSGLTPDQQNAWLGLVQGVAAGDRDAVRQLAEVAGALQSQYVDDDAPLSKADVDRMLAERDAAFQAEQQRQQEAAMASQVFTKLQGWGMDPQSYDAQQLVLAAMLKYGNDLDKAHEGMRAEREAADKAAVDAYLAKRRKDAKGPKPETGGGTTPSGAGEGPKTIDDAARAAMASFRADIS